MSYRVIEDNPMIDSLVRDLKRIGVDVLDAGSDEVMISAERSDNLEYDPPNGDGPYVSEDLQDVMEDYDAYLQWESRDVAFILLDF